MEPDHPFYSNISKDAGTQTSLKTSCLCESLKDTIARNSTFWNEEIVHRSRRKTGTNAAHGNSFRGIVKHLEGLSERGYHGAEPARLAFPMGYELDKNLKPIKPMQFLGDEEILLRKAMEAGAAQGKAKVRASSRLLPQGLPPPCPGPPYSSAPLPGTCPLMTSVGIISRSCR